MTFDLDRRFGGIARLYGEAALGCFLQSHVCVVGVGGVGSWVVEALARSAIGRLTLIDLDHVAESNTNRQLQALEDNFGKAKVQVLAERVGAINPLCQVTCVEDFVGTDNLAELITGDMDMVLDCIDSFRVKAALIAHCRRRKIRCITVGGAGGQTDPTLIRATDLARTEHDPLLAKTRKLLRSDFGFSRNLKRRFDVPAVYSTEQPRLPERGSACDLDEPPVASGLNCAGFGAATHVTASFGFVAVSVALERLARAARALDTIPAKASSG
jgi:tRNA A37 threonylcarbamoyladenosine dehydratase